MKLVGLIDHLSVHTQQGCVQTNLSNKLPYMNTYKMDYITELYGMGHEWVFAITWDRDKCDGKQQPVEQKQFKCLEK